MEKVPCIKCGANILKKTAESTKGLCMPCYKKKGNMNFISTGKENDIRCSLCSAHKIIQSRFVAIGSFSKFHDRWHDKEDIIKKDITEDDITEDDITIWKVSLCSTCITKYNLSILKKQEEDDRGMFKFVSWMIGLGIASILGIFALKVFGARGTIFPFQMGLIIAIVVGLIAGIIGILMFPFTGVSYFKNRRLIRNILKPHVIFTPQMVSLAIREESKRIERVLLDKGGKVFGRYEHFRLPERKSKSRYWMILNISEHSEKIIPMDWEHVLQQRRSEQESKERNRKKWWKEMGSNLNNTLYKANKKITKH